MVMFSTSKAAETSLPRLSGQLPKQSALRRQSHVGPWSHRVCDSRMSESVQWPELWGEYKDGVVRSWSDLDITSTFFFLQRGLKQTDRFGTSPTETTKHPDPQ